MRLQLISFDLMVALPIASSAIVLLFGGFYSAQSYIVASSRSQGELIFLYYRSQFAASLLETSQANYTYALGLLANFSETYGLNATLASMNDTGGCSFDDVCRVTTISSKSYLLVVKE